MILWCFYDITKRPNRIAGFVLFVNFFEYYQTLLYREAISRGTLHFIDHILYFTITQDFVLQCQYAHKQYLQKQTKTLQTTIEFMYDCKRYNYIKSNDSRY